jgi:Glycine zipper 2TM domain
MQVAPYRDGYDDRRSSAGYSEAPSSQHHHHSHEHQGGSVGYYDESVRPHSRGEGHHGSVGGEKGLGHGSSGGSHQEGVKDIGASLLGAAVGGFAGHEVGHGGVATLIGAVAGGVAGHKLEERHERHKEERERKKRENAIADRGYPDGPYGGYAEGRRRQARSRESESSGSETDSSYERRHNHRH